VLPLQLKGQVIGVLEVESDRRSAFDESDMTVLQSLTNQVAVAIENARLYEQASQLAALQERQKLARELHDSVSQALYSIALGARTARTQLDRDPAKVAEPLDYVLSLAQAALAEMRALIFELRPESLEQNGLVAVLMRQADSLRVRHRVEVTAHLGDEPPGPLEVKQAVYRIAQEALHNIVKHARASHVEVHLDCRDGVLRLEVHDDGAGFDPDGEFPGHLGLRSMRERAAQLGGKLVVESGVGQGTRVVAEVPLKRV
jgi:signal transduction histidine kinase